jgi:protein transport protein SEC31
MKVVSAVVEDRLSSVVNEFDGTSDTDWKEVMAILCTYCKPSNFAELAETVAQRLESSHNPAASLAYLAAGKFEKVVEAWIADLKNSTAKTSQDMLQDFIEKVSVFARITEKAVVSEELADKYAQYAQLLISQGCLVSACRYLDYLKIYAETHHLSAILRDRTFQAQGTYGEPPPFPFTKMELCTPLQSSPEQSLLPVQPSVSQPPTRPVEVQIQSSIPSQTQPQPPQMQYTWPQQTPSQVVTQPVTQVTSTQPSISYQQQMSQQHQPNQTQWQPHVFPHQPQQQQNLPHQHHQQNPQLQQHHHWTTTTTPQPVVEHQQPPYPPPMHQHLHHVPPQHQPPQQYAYQQHTTFHQPQFPSSSPSVASVTSSAPPPPPSVSPQTFTPAGLQTPCQPSPANYPPATSTMMPQHGQPPIASPQTHTIPASSTTASSMFSLTSVSTTKVPPEWQPMITNFTNAYARMDNAGTEGRKKPPVEKALIALFTKLNNNEVSPEVCGLLLRFSQVCECGGPEGKDIIRRLTDQFWDQYKPYKDLKFLNK